MDITPKFSVMQMAHEMSSKDLLTYIAGEDRPPVAKALRKFLGVRSKLTKRQLAGLLKRAEDWDAWTAELDRLAGWRAGS